MNVKVALVIMGCLGLVFLSTQVLFRNPLWSGSDPSTDVATTSQTIMNAINGVESNKDAVIAKWFAPLTPFTFGGVSMQASIADTDAERAKGLSDTPYIPDGIAKVFIFDSSEPWSFWMKDMNYPIDIFWLNDNGTVVHLVESVTPDTYPETSFAPPTPARYVVETKAGFAKNNDIAVGAVAEMSEIMPRRE